MWQDVLQSFYGYKARRRWLHRERKRRVLEQQLNTDCGEDERIALFLQNEEFLSELRANQDFLSTLDDDLGERGLGPDADAFKERLRSMGKISRNKFSQLARVFQRRKKGRSAKDSAGDTLLLGNEPLIAEKEEEAAYRG